LPPEAATTPALGIFTLQQAGEGAARLNEPACCSNSSFQHQRRGGHAEIRGVDLYDGVRRMWA